MINHTRHADYIIIGAGIMGLSLARTLLARSPDAKIKIIEKEKQIGLHASGRNSGVLHSGIYYKENTLKAKLCVDGARLLSAYCKDNNLPLNKIGKLIVPDCASDGEKLRFLYERGLKNGAKLDFLTSQEVAQKEPLLKQKGVSAIYARETSVFDPQAILQHLQKELQEANVQFHMNAPCVAVHTKQRTVLTQDGRYSYGHLFNAAGLYADKIAATCGLRGQYVILPFKGVYYKVNSMSPIKANHLIYPLPDINVPFLGIHLTKAINGELYLGPTAYPALGRQNYKAFKGMNLADLFASFWGLSQLYMLNKQGFRTYAHDEIHRFTKRHFVKSAQALIPDIHPSHLCKADKVGIRAQLFDKKKKELVMDFMVEKTDNETHILNAVSPAFTSAFSFSQYIVNHLFQ